MKFPLEYQKNKCSFLGREFYIDKRVHIPRKNTEPLVILALKYIKKIKRKVVCADIGTGAGVIAISLVLESNLVKKVFATDIYSGAISVAKRNVKTYGLTDKIIIRKGNLLNPIKNENLDVIVVNLPHASEEIFKGKGYLVFEHERATLAGKSGLEILEAFFKQLSKYKYFKEILAVFLKIPTFNVQGTVNLARKYFPSSKFFLKKDEKEKERYLIIQNK